MGMMSGLLVGLGQGIQGAGQAYGNAKQAAVERMFKEQQMALQQQQAERAQRSLEFEEAYKVLGQLPAGSEFNPSQFGPGAATLISNFSKMAAVPDPQSPLAGARSLPMQITQAPYVGGFGQPGEMQPVQAPEGEMASQDLTPKTRQARVSIPFEDARARAQQVTELGRQNRFIQGEANKAARQQASLQVRQRIADQRNNLARQALDLRQQIANTQDSRVRESLELRRQQLDEQIAMHDAQLQQWDFQNDLGTYRAQYGGSNSGSSINDLFMGSMITGEKPTPEQVQTALSGKGKDKPPAPVAPRHTVQGGRVGRAPAGDSAYEEYLKRRGQQ